MDDGADVGGEAPFLGFHARHFARNLADLALQVAHPGFIGVFADDAQHSLVGEVQLAGVQPVLFHLARDQELAAISSFSSSM